MAVFGLGVRGHADPVIRDYCRDFAWIGLGQLGRAARFFRRCGVAHATMAGKIHKVILFQRWAWLRHLPDAYGFRTFAPHFLLRAKDNRDDSLLSTVCEAFARRGIRMFPATDLVPEVLVEPGVLTRRQPTAAQWQDIAFGWRIAKEMGRLDIGQTVVVKDLAVLAVEAIEGTDSCILRAGELCGAGGFTVVKVAKPRQDMRFDVPTIGMNTVRNVANGRGAVLAVEAKKTIFLHRRDVLDHADAHGVALVALGGA
ncbi:hypothetical protein JCM17478_32710 [Thermopirellula anaerolimosa]